MIYESSWEVCNKMGGIYTVLSTRARRMMEVHNGEICFIGPLRKGNLPEDFDPTPPDWLQRWYEHCATTLGLSIVVGRWRVPSSPPVLLVDYTPLFDERGVLFFELWERFGLTSDSAGDEYEHSILFGIAASRVMMSMQQCLETKDNVAIFNEWMLGGGLLYTKKYCPSIRTIFISHATSVGRSIAGNGKELYAYMDGYNGDQMAQELGVVAKHSIEKKAAIEADIFATVSSVTAREAEQLIGRKPIVLPNGFESDFVPKGSDYDRKRMAARAALIRTAQELSGQDIPAHALLVSLGGRYEYRNKGIDIYMDALSLLQKKYANPQYQPLRPLVAFLLVPAWVNRSREDLKYRMSHRQNDKQTAQIRLQYPMLTHWLHNTEQDIVVRQSRSLGLTNGKESSILFVFVPCYLDGHDGIFEQTYYDLLIGTDLNVYPSYYEPWGYTPLESIAFGIPAITTDLAGFGMWAMQRADYRKDQGPVYVIPRCGRNDADVASQTAELLDKLLNSSADETARQKEEAQAIAEEASWQHFYDLYLQAFTQSLEG